MNALLHLADAPVTLILMALTTTVSVFAFNNPKLADTLVLDVGAVRERGEYQRLFTSGFVHGDYIHLTVNMLTLLSFGPILELARGVGAARFTLLYLISLLAGSAMAYLDNFHRADYRVLGASGAIAGVMVAFSVIAPLYIVQVFFILPMPVVIFTAGFIGWSMWAARNVRDNIAHSAHLGGALAGLVVTCILWPHEVRGLPRDLGLPF
jgi:membrane associated rhomboid family serine protease